jgi:hypothetical protein
MNGAIPLLHPGAFMVLSGKASPSIYLYMFTFYEFFEESLSAQPM